MKNMKDEKNLIALAEVRNIIAQEIYKISVVKQYPEDFLKIIELYQTISKKTVSAGMSDESDSLYRFKRELVNCVVEKKNASEWKENLIYFINSAAEDNYGSEMETADKLKKISSDIFKSNREFNTNIPHKYPPELLLEWYDYMGIYGYFYNKDYEMKSTREKVTDDSFFVNKGEYILTITSCRHPVTIVRPYEKKFFEVSKNTEVIEVPFKGYSKGLTPKTFQCGNPIDIEKALIMMNVDDDDISNVELTKELNFKINLQEYISRDDLELIISKIRTCICLEQNNNSRSLKVIASTDEEINRAFNFDELSVPSYGEHELIMSAKNPVIPDFKVALKFLVGLSLMQKTSLMFHKSYGHYTWNKRKNIIISTEVDILRIELNKAFVKTSAYEIKSNYINEGYKKVLEAVNDHIKSFQYKRVQFGCAMNSEQRLALKSAPEVNLDDLHYDDVQHAKKKISEHKKQGREASIRVRKNGSYVITW